MELEYHAVTVFEDDVLCAADSISSDYGHGTVMLLKFNKFRPGYDSARLIKDHLLTQPSSLRVMHGGLQVGGQFARRVKFCTLLPLFNSSNTCLPLPPSTTLSLFHSRLKTCVNLFHAWSASTYLDCVLGLYWIGLILLNGFHFIDFSFFITGYVVD